MFERVVPRWQRQKTDSYFDQSKRSFTMSDKNQNTENQSSNTTDADVARLKEELLTMARTVDQKVKELEKAEGKSATKFQWSWRKAGKIAAYSAGAALLAVGGFIGYQHFAGSGSAE